MPASHPHEPHLGSVSARLNWLRAGVLGANDGIVSTAGIVVGVAAATVARLRNFVGGGLALAVTYLIGHLVGAAIT